MKIEEEEEKKEDTHKSENDENEDEKDKPCLIIHDENKINTQERTVNNKKEHIHSTVNNNDNNILS